MKLLKNSKRVFVMILLSASYFLVSLAQARTLVTEEQMLEYLKENAAENGLCGYAPLHEINIDSSLFMIRAIDTLVAPQGKIYFELGSMQDDFRVKLFKTFQQLPQFELLRFTNVMVWFKPAAGASRSQIIKGLYWLKKEVDLEATNVYIQSGRRVCPGGTSVNNF